MKIFITIEGKPFVSFSPFPLCSHYVISLVDSWLPDWLIVRLAALQSNHHYVSGRPAEWMAVKVTDRLVCWLTLSSVAFTYDLCIASWFKRWSSCRSIFFWSSICLIKKKQNKRNKQKNCVLVCLSTLSDFTSCLLLAPNQPVPTEHMILLKLGHGYIFV